MNKYDNPLRKSKDQAGGGSRRKELKSGHSERRITPTHNDERGPNFYGFHGS